MQTNHTHNNARVVSMSPVAFWTCNFTSQRGTPPGRHLRSFLSLMVRRGQQAATAAGPVPAHVAPAEGTGETRPRVDTGGSSAPPAKKTRKGQAKGKQKAKKTKEDESGDNSELLDLLPLLVKLVLQNTQSIRDLASAVFSTWFIGRDKLTAIRSKEAMGRYNELVKTDKTAGPPHLHAFLGFMEGAKNLDWMAEEAKAAEVTEFDRRFEGMDEKDQIVEVPYFRMKRIQKDDVWLLQYVVKREETARIIKNVLEKEQATVKEGRAPRGVMERLLSKALQDESTSRGSQDEMK